tara:strand:- start:109 stop:276 length:168 start_codon:yes stop_codon:yes gene_type:complete
MIKWIIDSLENDKSPILDSRVYSDLVTEKILLIDAIQKVGRLYLSGMKRVLQVGF